MEERCKGYCGLTCINGSCPKANADEYAERGYDVVHDCDECGYYKGCEGCCFDGTDMCVNKPMSTKSGKKHIKDSTELSGGHLW